LKSIEGAGTYSEGSVLFLKNGPQIHAIRITCSVLRDKRERNCGHVLAISNITELLAMAEKLQHQATHDELTALPNRRLLLDRIQGAIATARRSEECVAIMFVDLDDFKKINDSLGHASGDHVLKAVAARLRTIVRETDTVSRWGGDEFVIVATRLPEHHAIKEIATKILNVLSPPFSVADQEIAITASVGISLYPDDGDDVDALLKKADIAMYRVKDRQRGSFGIYSYDMNIWTAERLAFERRMREACDSDEFELHYQPQLDLSTSQIRGAEALLRWRQNNGEWISPAYFIPIAEESELIQKIGEWVIRRSFLQTKAWQESALSPLSISVNLSVRQLMHRDFHQFVANAIDETQLDPTWIRFEITETTLMRDFEGCRDKLEQLKALGFSLSIDDFGTGYASLSYLRRFPVDELKIDGSFVRNIASQQDDAAIVQAVIALARGMHLSVVAEGVEDSAQLSFLRRNHCDTAQGYLISRPVPAVDLLHFIQSQDGQYVH